MKIAAKTREGTEFCYSASSAHRISFQAKNSPYQVFLIPGAEID